MTCSMLFQKKTSQPRHLWDSSHGGQEFDLHRPSLVKFHAATPCFCLGHREMKPEIRKLWFLDSKRGENQFSSRIYHHVHFIFPFFVRTVSYLKRIDLASLKSPEVSNSSLLGTGNKHLRFGRLREIPGKIVKNIWHSHLRSSKVKDGQIWSDSKSF